MTPVETADPCPDGKHDPEWSSEAGETVCASCGLPASTIVNRLEHTLYVTR